MKFASLSRVVRQTLFQLRDEGIDVQLVGRFVEQCDQDAFSELVRRHGPMVMGVCRRVLGHVQDAEDAFQATFVILARKAATIAEKNLLGGWLHGVAYHVALEARKRALRERTRNQPNGEAIVRDLPEEPEENTGPTLSDLRAVLDEELQRLPEKCRAALVLCYLEGKTNRDAARLLGYSTSWVEKKLIKGRGLLRSRLAKRGLVLNELALVALLVPDRACAALSSSLFHSTAQVALGHSGVPVPVTVLVEAGSRVLGRSKVMSWAALVGTVLLVATGISVSLAVLPKPASETPRESGLMQVQRVFEGHTGFVNSVAMAPDGLTLISGSQDTTARVWNTADGQTRHVLQNTGPGVPGNEPASRHYAPKQAVAYSANGKLVAVCATDHQVSLWDPETGKQLAVYYVGQSRAHDLAFSSDGRQLAAVSWNGNVRRWDIPSGQELANRYCSSPGAPWRCAAFSPDAQALALGLERVHLYDLAMATDRVVATSAGCNCLRFAPNGRTLAVGKADGTVQLLDVASGSELGLLKDHAPLQASGNVTRADISKWITALRFSADGRRLGVGTMAGNITVWDMITGQPIARCLQASSVPSLDFSPDGQTIVSADDLTIKLWK